MYIDCTSEHIQDRQVVVRVRIGFGRERLQAPHEWIINQSSDTSEELHLQLLDAELEITAAAVMARKIKGSGEGSKYGIDGYLQLKTAGLGNIRQPYMSNTVPFGSIHEKSNKKFIYNPRPTWV